MGLVPHCDICDKKMVLLEEGDDREYCDECNAWYKGIKTSIWAEAKTELENAVRTRKEELGGA